MATDAAEALAEAEAEEAAERAAEGPADRPRVERTSSGEEPPELVELLSEAEFVRLFCDGLDAPGEVYPPLRHIGTRNGQPMRRQAAEETARRIHRLCVTSSWTWLQDLLAIDHSGLQRLYEWALVGWFAIGTAQGAARAMAEMTERAEPGPAGPGPAEAEAAP